MKNLLKAVAAFQQECPTIHKATQGYGYTYADLPDIFKVINPLMKKHGLGFMQEIHDDTLITTIFHIESGEMRESRANLIQGVQLKGMNDFQVFGSNLTYMRRYCLSCCLGIVTDKDIDAAGEQTKSQAPASQKPKIILNTDAWQKAREYIMGGGDVDIIKAKYDISPTLIQKLKSI